MFVKSSNGRANIWGAVEKTIKQKADETVSAVAVTLAEQATEKVRLAKGESKFKFYGRIAWEWAKKHWYWFLLPVALVIVWKIGKKIFTRKKGKRRF